MVDFFKEHVKLRAFLIALFVVLGVIMVVSGWKMTGELVGLGIMIVGVICLLVALFVYNEPFKTPSRG